MPRISVILPAAGSGRRFGGNESKILQPLAGRPVFLRSVDLFATRGDVCQILLVVSPADRKSLQQHYGKELLALGTQLVTGGATRSESVRNALSHVLDEVDLVCVHDAVRPCVTQGLIDAVFTAAAHTAAAILAWPVHATLKDVDEAGTIRRTVCREGLWEAQTPQVFRKDLLKAAYDTGHNATDDAELVQRRGQTVTVVKGDPHNIKITTPADLAFAQALIETTST
jgi:2-C-methyl-D-erythritol 4-phosphate cytidylyltransferase